MEDQVINNKDTITTLTKYLSDRNVTDTDYLKFIHSIPVVANPNHIQQNGVDYSISHFLDTSSTPGHNLIEVNQNIGSEATELVAIGLIEGDDSICLNVNDGCIYLWLYENGEGEKIKVAKTFKQYLEDITNQGVFEMKKTETKKKKKNWFARFFVVFLCGLMMSGCAATDWLNDKDIKYSASTRFLYSTDEGNSWSETVQSVYTNETYYLAIEMQVVQSKDSRKEKTVEATITIPNTSVLDCYLDDHPGTSITGDVDLVKEVTTYKFNLIAGTSPSKFRVVFECMPIEAGRSTISVTYDDNLSDSWDASGTIKYIDKE